MKTRKLLFASIIAAMPLACGCNSDDEAPTPEKTDPETPNTETIDPTKMISNTGRIPFVDKSPTVRKPDTIVSSGKLPLEFFGWGEQTDYHFTLTFPEARPKETSTIHLKYKMCAADGKTPGEWDNITCLWVLNKQDNQWYEIARACTPYGNAFSSSWEKSFYIDVTHFAHMLDGETEFRLYYGGFDTNNTRGHAIELTYNIYYGTVHTYVPKSYKIYDSSRDDNSAYRGWVYGVTHAHPETGESLDIESELYMGTKEIPTYNSENFEKILVRVCITGHGHDNGLFVDRGGITATNAAEFDENTYRFFINGVKQKNFGTIFYSNANNYPQAGTYYFDRANWAPGNPVNVQYWNLKIPEGDTLTFNMDLEKYISLMNDWRAEGIAQYIVQVDAFYVAAN